MSDTRTADAIQWYDAHAATLARQNATIPASELLSWLANLLPAEPGLVLDRDSQSDQWDRCCR
jgi:hypothetical protein